MYFPTWKYMYTFTVCKLVSTVQYIHVYRMQASQWDARNRAGTGPINVMRTIPGNKCPNSEIAR